MITVTVSVCVSDVFTMSVFYVDLVEVEGIGEVVCCPKCDLYSYSLDTDDDADADEVRSVLLPAVCVLRIFVVLVFCHFDRVCFSLTVIEKLFTEFETQL